MCSFVLAAIGPLLLTVPVPQHCAGSLTLCSRFVYAEAVKTLSGLSEGISVFFTGARSRRLGFASGSGCRG